MIVVFATRAHRYTFDIFLYYWAARTNNRYQILDYELLPHVGRVPRGVFLFTDLERLTPAMMSLASSVHDQLRAAGMRVLNDPSRTLRRFDLMQTLHGAGHNSFRAVRVADAHTLRMPVFVRGENDHQGSVTELLRSPAELEAALDRLQEEGRNLAKLLVIEFCDTRDRAGVYRKYSAFAVGDRVIPRHILFGRKKWVVKTTEVITPRSAREERLYATKNPHADQLREIFRLARVGWGRIDYGVVDGRVQTWEINTNPMLLETPPTYAKERLPAQIQFARSVNAALLKLDDAEPGPPVGLDLDPELAATAGAEMEDRAAKEIRYKIEARTKRKKRRRRRGV